ncbi:MAG: pyrimidine 5'-nucleotidase [Aestuariivirga sp.]|uniref:pyrimidine 5'-nucleotidase n=1 Tax=Aestuariivirga sp. TaxID=2650926 RepID=UPI0025C5B0E8|nr:pyrimidine 5'-nucleotidase [Aestuariivirga sp.]MCA3562663.1 pyrimidine 5'-nucleotidase [Aestuariivirga sp.]
MKGFAHVDTWVFDLDNTLYPASCRLFDQIDVKMGNFVSKLLNVDYDEAKRRQKDMFYKYGTTLRGLMTEHGITPDDFLDYVHDIDHSPVPLNRPLDDALHALPGRKLIFTNGTVAHAEKVLARIGITHHFGGIFDIVHSDFIPKPGMEPYKKFVRQMGITPGTSAMFEDIARNLEAPHALGMATVLVVSPGNNDAEHLNKASGGTAQEHIHHVTDDLASFLAGLTRDLKTRS